jgi:Leucine-rich repeat (LRR) protein
MIEKAELLSHLKSLKILDLQDNRIVQFKYDLLSKTNLMIKHEFIEKEDQIFLKYHFESKNI